MESFNYNHLFYFWTVARNGSVSRASAELKVSQPTVSEQIGKLETALGVTLFERAGRGIRLSSSGQSLFGYADQIFRLGQQIVDVVCNGAPSITRLAVGISRAVPSAVAFKFIAPALRETNIQVSCSQDHSESLLPRLALRQLDVVISDSPVSATENVRLFSHKLASSGLSFLASPKLRLRGKFPQMLDGAPMLLPEANGRMYSEILHWLEKSGVRPKVVGEFSDSGLLEAFALNGSGVFAIPSIVEGERRATFNFNVLGKTNAVQQEFYAITTERRPANSAVLTMLGAKPKRA